MDAKTRLDQVYKQIEDIKNDPDYPDRDKVSRKLRGEKRKLERDLGLRDEGTKPAADGTKSSRKKRKENQDPSETKKRARQDRKKRNRAFDDGTVAEVESLYLKEIPTTMFEQLVEMGLKDRRDDPAIKRGDEGRVQAYTIKKSQANEHVQFIVDKFIYSWESKPRWFTLLKEGEYQMLSLGPIESDKTIRV